MKEKSGYELYAYCLMGNHIHLLLKEVAALKAGIVKDIANYRWSSYGEYIGDPGICDVDFAFNMFSTDRVAAVEQFKEFNLAENQDQCLDYNQNIRLNDTEASDFIRSISGVQSPTKVQGFEKAKRDEVIKRCKEKGLSIRQIARLTGVSFGVVRAI